jgi:hypothetical protein
MTQRTQLRDVLASIRSKNAGPFAFTIDVFFKQETDWQAVVDQAVLTPETVSELYTIEPERIRVHNFKPALAINAEGHIFAGTQSQFGEGGGMFRSVDNGDTWTKQVNGFTALDVNALAIDSSQSRHVRPDAASWENRLGTRWWQWSGRSLLASQRV